MYDEKEEEGVNSDDIISDLNCTLLDKENLIRELNLQCEELQYALSSLKLDFETNNDQNDKKVASLRLIIVELEEKISYCNVNIANQEDRNHELEDKFEIMKSEKEDLAEKYLKLTISFEDLGRAKENVENVLQRTKKERKELLEKNNETEFHLTQQKELLEKVREGLEEEEKKNVSLKEFVANLMKQK